MWVSVYYFTFIFSIRVHTYIHTCTYIFYLILQVNLLQATYKADVDLLNYQTKQINKIDEIVRINEIVRVV